MKDYYKILGVHKSSSAEEVKKAYRKLAHQHHPDKQGGDEAKFKEINEAYQVLSDLQKRAQYDRFGTAEPFGSPRWDYGEAGGAGGWDFSGFGGVPGWEGFNVQYDFGDLGDVFESFFEGLGVRPKRPTYRRGSDLETIEEITLEEVFRGAVKDLHIKTSVTCKACNGQGGDPAAGSKQCTVCHGRGEVREERKTFFGSFAQVRACNTCKGFGQIPNKVCSICKGGGRVLGEHKLRVEILPGIQDNQTIKIKGGGEAGERGTGVGDLYVRVRIKPHHTFARRNDDLVVRKEVKVMDLLLGRKIEIPTISGGKIHVEIPAGFNLKEALKIPGEGMPRFSAGGGPASGWGGRGDLLVDLIIKAPKKPSGRMQKLLEDLEKE